MGVFKTVTKPVIYCDFDGTITESDNIVALMEKFGPNDAEAIKESMSLIE